MTYKAYINFFIIMLVSLGLLATFHFYFLQPKLGVNLQSPSGLTETTRDKGAKLNLVDFFNTLSQMKKFQDATHLQAPPKPADRRNPFYWPEELKKPALSATSMIEKSAQAKTEASKELTKQKPPSPLPVLQMTVVGEEKRLALLNNQFITTGDSVNGDRVKEIGTNYVVITRETGNNEKIFVGKKPGFGIAIETPTVSKDTKKHNKKTQEETPDPVINQQNKALQDLLMQINQSR